MQRFFLLLALCFPLFAAAQAGGAPKLWTPAAEPGAGERRIQARAYQVFALDLDSLRSLLAQAPMERSPAAKTQALPLAFPMPDGSLLRCAVWESPIMASGLAERYPGIRTYAGRAIDDPAITLRFDVTPQGFHAMLFAPQQGTVFIDPLYVGQDRLYQVYAKKDALRPEGKHFTCAFEEGQVGDRIGAAQRRGTRFGDCQLRTYRLALSCTGEYAQFHGGTVPLVLGAMVTTMNRVNGVFERDFAVRMTLIPENDALVFLNAASDPFTNEDVGLMLGENQNIIDSLIGTPKYDIGHVFGTIGGGVAGYGVVCAPDAKAIGATSGGAPVGDPFDIDYVAHEMGHQFAGSHTFRGCGNDNPNDPTALEPGSGSTIMAYAGICGDNVQFNSNDYFHGYNLEEMSNFIAFGGGNTCGTQTPLDNAPPQVASSGQAFTIPVGTPFFLSAEASDPDGDALSYCWEQFDAELSPQPPLPGNVGGPNFRTFSPSASPTRYFPDLAALANGGPFDWEVLPTVAREMHFRVSVRDNAPGGGCTDHGSVSVTVSDAAGPFVLNHPDAASVLWAAGGQEMVSWNTANTALAPVSCAAVDILLSTDGGLSYPFVLASGVPNNGAYAVDVPTVLSDSARVMVRCAGNIFFDISNENFSIGTPAAGFLLQSDPNALTSCGAEELSIALGLVATGGFSGPVALSVSGLPEGAGATFSPSSLGAGESATLTLSGLADAEEGLYTLVLAAEGNGNSQTAALALALSQGLPGPVLPAAPVDGAVNAQLSPLMAWHLQPDADSYTLQIADNPGFAPVLFQQTGVGSSPYQVPTALPEGTALYWRLKAHNACGEGPFGPSQQFSTLAVACTTLVGSGLPLAISDSDTATVLASVAFSVPGIVTDVNVPVLQGSHNWISDLQFSLIAPSGTSSTLLGPICWDEKDFDIRFDDQAAAPYGSVPCPPADGGLYQPNMPLSLFNGQNAQGDWTLQIFDSWPADGGALEAWALEICHVPPPNAGCALSALASVATDGCVPCSGDIALSLSGATGQVAYVWDDGSLAPSRSGVCEGSYVVTIVDSASCALSLQIDVPSPADIISVSTTVLPDADSGNASVSAVATGGAAPLSYLWNTGDTTAQIQQVPPGFYSVTVTDANGCTAFGEALVEGFSGLIAPNNLVQFRLTPNPSNGQVRALISLAQEEDVLVELYNVLGQRLQHRAERGRDIDVLFDLSGQGNGVYFVSLRTAGGRATAPFVLAQ